MKDATSPGRVKRTTMLLDARLLAEAQAALGEKTATATVQRALREALKIAARARLLSMEGTVKETVRPPPRRRFG